MKRQPTPTDPLAEGPTPKAKKGFQRKDRDASNVLTQDRGTYRFRFELPPVARFVARVVVLHGMDYESAIRTLSQGHLEESQIIRYAEKAEKSPEVQAAIQFELETHGLDENSKSAFVQEMWDWLRSADNDLKMKAAGILGRGFIGEKVGAEKPEELPIANLGDAIQSMLGIKSNATKPDTKSTEPPVSTPPDRLAN